MIAVIWQRLHRLCPPIRALAWPPPAPLQSQSTKSTEDTHTHTHSVLPAVYDGGSGAGRSVHVVPDRPDELDQGLGALWDAVVGPHGVVEVTQHAGVTAAALLSGFIDYV